jgi:hypothetical protein
LNYLEYFFARSENSCSGNSINTAGYAPSAGRQMYHGGRNKVGQVGHGPPNIPVGWATMHLASMIREALRWSKFSIKILLLIVDAFNYIDMGVGNMDTYVYITHFKHVVHFLVFVLNFFNCLLNVQQFQSVPSFSVRASLHYIRPSCTVQCATSPLLVLVA